MSDVNLERIGWQNGTLISKAKVEIGGVIYEVEPEEYSGSTPLSAENLIQMEDNIEDAINEGTSKMEGTVLYNNATGSSSSIILSQSAANFDYIEIYFAGVQGSEYYYDFNKIDNPNNKQVSLLSVISGANNFYFVGANASISDTNISLSNNRRVWFYHDSNAFFDTSALIYITKVVGYKY